VNQGTGLFNQLMQVKYLNKLMSQLNAREQFPGGFSCGGGCSDGPPPPPFVPGTAAHPAGNATRPAGNSESGAPRRTGMWDGASILRRAEFESDEVWGLWASGRGLMEMETGKGREEKR